MLGVAYVGAIRALSERGYLANLKHFAGTSAGSIVAGALACKVSVTYIANLMQNVDFNEFLDDSWGIVETILQSGMVES